MDFKVIIPVRLASKRLPNKPLLPINGRPLLQHVYERAAQSGASQVVVATDSLELKALAESFGADVCMTASDHPSGTDRLGEAVTALGFDDDDIVLNLQGDEAMIPPKLITQVAHDLTVHDNTKMSTLAHPIRSMDELRDPNVVKVVMNQRGFALYFSRAPIPWERDAFAADTGELTGPHYRHIGLYAYRVNFLHQYLAWEQSPLGALESLEQLRVLYHGGRIHVTVTTDPVPPGVDTPEDLARVEALMASQPQKG